MREEYRIQREALETDIAPLVSEMCKLAKQHNIRSMMRFELPYEDGM